VGNGSIMNKTQAVNGNGTSNANGRTKRKIEKANVTGRQAMKGRTVARRTKWYERRKVQGCENASSRQGRQRAEAESWRQRVKWAGGRYAGRQLKVAEFQQTGSGV